MYWFSRTLPRDNDIDLERCPTASVEQGNSCQQSSGLKAGRHCAVAIQYLDGRALLINATIEEEVDGDIVFSSAKKEISQAFTKSWQQRLLGNLFMDLVVGAARIKQVIHCGPRPLSSGHQGPPISPSRVYLQDFTVDPLLTEALHSPQLLLPSASYPLSLIDSDLSPPGFVKASGQQTTQFSNDIDSKSMHNCVGHDDQEIIVVRRVIDRTKVAWLLVLLLSFSPALGIGVGICSHNADAGIAVSAGVFALASFVQGLVAWIQG